MADKWQTSEKPRRNAAPEEKSDEIFSVDKFHKDGTDTEVPKSALLKEESGIAMSQLAKPAEPSDLPPM